MPAIVVMLMGFGAGLALMIIASVYKWVLKQLNKEVN